jgi:hypothetical protein
MKRINYLENLGKWQAFSHPALADAKPETLFEPGFVEKYVRLHNDLWWRTIRVHGTLRTLDELKEFPFDHLYAPNGMEFWRLVIENFLDIACLMLHGLVSDTGSDVLSIPTFRNEIIKAPWLSPQKLGLLTKTLKQCEFDAHVQSIADRVKDIRHNRIAHRLIDMQSGGPLQAYADVSLEEIWRLFDATQSLFGALSFGSAYVTLAGDLIPSTVGGQPTRTCLDEVLDAVLRDNFFVNRPEQRGKWWPRDRERMKPKDLQLMNDLLKRIGLPEA